MRFTPWSSKAWSRMRRPTARRLVFSFSMYEASSLLSRALRRSSCVVCAARIMFSHGCCRPASKLERGSRTRGQAMVLVVVVECDQLGERPHPALFKPAEESGQADVFELPNLQATSKGVCLSSFRKTLTGNWHNSLRAVDCQLLNVTNADRALDGHIESLQLGDGGLVLMFLPATRLKSTRHPQRATHHLLYRSFVRPTHLLRHLPHGRIKEANIQTFPTS